MRPGGPSINPRGRPRRGDTLAEHVRDAVDLDELIEFHRGVMMSASTPWRERLQAAAWLSDRGWGKPISTVDLTVGIEQNQLPAAWHMMTAGEREQWLDADAQLALDAPDELTEDGDE